MIGSIRQNPGFWQNTYTLAIPLSYPTELKTMVPSSTCKTASIYCVLHLSMSITKYPTKKICLKVLSALHITESSRQITLKIGLKWNRNMCARSSARHIKKEMTNWIKKYKRAFCLCLKRKISIMLHFNMEYKYFECIQNFFT